MNPRLVAWLSALAVAAALIPQTFSQTNRVEATSVRVTNGVAELKPITTGQRVFTAGNSFHAWFIAPILQDMANGAGIKDHEIVGVSKIGGSRAIQHWDVPDE